MIGSLVAALLSLQSLPGCTRAELVSKSDAYDAAIWDANNKQILLNAVRASQRAPMSFVGFGEMVASPSFSGTAGSSFNFTPSGLASYALNPSVSYNGGFSTYSISNNNTKDFVQRIHDPMDPRIKQYFEDHKWPKEIVNLLMIESLQFTPAQFAQLLRARDNACSRPTSGRVDEICDQLRKDADAYRERGCPPRGGTSFLNSAREFCSMNRFQTVLRTLRLVNAPLPPHTRRTLEGLFYYLGELIAAQNYSAQPYVPEVLMEGPDGIHRTIRLFVVERGNPGPGIAAVHVNLNGEDFFIPKPRVGAIDEERSMQVLDLVSIALTMVTTKDSLPKANTLSLIAVR
ncbi:hypothetical protein XH90_09280 [Bradyrhizobium sp. CCBAU 53338]|nr:hypothetical protein XH90_09280 [Bradyrhizobium sp. CCBAU 53338]